MPVEPVARIVAVEPRVEATGHPLGELVPLRTPNGRNVLIEDGGLDPDAIPALPNHLANPFVLRTSGGVPELDIERLDLAIADIRIVGRDRAFQYAARARFQSCLGQQSL